MALATIDVKMLHPKEVAGMLNIEPKTLTRWRAKGIGPPYVRIGRTIRYERTTLRVWIRAHLRITPDT